MPAGPGGPPLEWLRRSCRGARSSGQGLQESALQDGHVLVAPAGAADENSSARVGLRIAPRAEERMRTFDGRQNSFALGAFGERIQGFVVGRRLVGDAP